MPKKLFAVTNIKTSLPGQEVAFFAAGSEVDTSKFTKEQLLDLHDQGAVEVRVVDDEVMEPVQETTEANADEPVTTEEKPAATEESTTEEPAVDATTSSEDGEPTN